jgi:hypothetical protein
MYAIISLNSVGRLVAIVMQRIHMSGTTRRSIFTTAYGPSVPKSTMSSAANSINLEGSESEKDKPNISVENLKAHGIEYNLLIPDETRHEHLPQGINRVRARLLEGITPPSQIPQFYRDRKDRKDFMERELSQAMKAWTVKEKAARDSWSLMPPPTAWCDSVHPNTNEEIYTENTNKDIDECREIAEDAAKEYRRAGEASWTRFLRNNIFRDFRSTTRPLRK